MAKTIERMRSLKAAAPEAKSFSLKLSNLKTKPKVLIGVAGPLVLALAIGGVALFNVNKITTTSGWVDHTRVVLAEASAIVASAVDMETGMRGYLLAGQEQFLDPYKNGEKAAYEAMEKLQETVSDNPKQVARLKEAETVLRDWQTKVAELQIALRRSVGNGKTMNDVADLVAEARGKQYFDKFRQIMADFKAEEAALMTQRKTANESTTASTFTLIITCMAGAVVIGLGLAWIIGGSIAGPIGRMTEAMGKLANGDTSVEIEGTERGDEVGDMAKATQVFKDNAIETERLRQENVRREEQAAADKRKQMQDLAENFESTVGSVIAALASSASELQTTARSMSTTAEQTNSQAMTVASASEEASSNVQTVASAAEELSSSISEISRQIAESNSISQRAVHDAEATNTSVKGLADAAQKIGNIIGLIQDIAEQTNLLALNATIEAARAGEAGKGFAVVASEVKSLANQTAKATEEIAAQVESMQGATESTVSAIENIAEVIKQISGNAAAIASAVEEQNASTQEIARNVQEAAAGTQQVSETITQVRSTAESTGSAASQVLSRSEELSQQSEQLRGEVQKFLAGLNAA